MLRSVVDIYLAKLEEKDRKASFRGRDKDTGWGESEFKITLPLSHSQTQELEGNISWLSLVQC